MSGIMESHLSFLKGKINLLFIEPKPLEIKPLTSLLANNFFYSIYFVKDRIEADNLLSTGSNCNVCISELFSRQTSEDGSFIQKKYGKRIPIIYRR